MLPGSALKVPGGGGGGGGGGWVPTHFQVSLQLQLRLSWAVTIVVKFCSLSFTARHFLY